MYHALFSICFYFSWYPSTSSHTFPSSSILSVCVHTSRVVRKLLLSTKHAFSDSILSITESFSSVTASSCPSWTHPPLSSSAADTPCTMCAQNPRRTVAVGAVTPTRSQVRRGRRCSPWGPALFLRFNLRVLLDPGQLWHLQCRASVGRCFKWKTNKQDSLFCLTQHPHGSDLCFLGWKTVHCCRSPFPESPVSIIVAGAVLLCI